MAPVTAAAFPRVCATVKVAVTVANAAVTPADLHPVLICAPRQAIVRIAIPYRCPHIVKVLLAPDRRLLLSGGAELIERAKLLIAVGAGLLEAVIVQIRVAVPRHGSGRCLRVHKNAKQQRDDEPHLSVGIN